MQRILRPVSASISGRVSVATVTVVCQLQRAAYGWFMQVIEYDFIGLDLRPCPAILMDFRVARIFSPARRGGRCFFFSRLAAPTTNSANLNK